MALNIIAGVMIIIASFLHAWFGISSKAPQGNTSRTFYLYGKSLLVLTILLLISGSIIFWISAGILTALIVAGIYFFILPFIALPILEKTMANKRNTVPQNTGAKKIIISRKNVPGPDSILKDYPLLYLYFDDFYELQIADKQGGFDISVQSGYLDADGFTGILADKDRFLELYRKNLLRLILNDGTLLQRRLELIFWDRILHPENHQRKLHMDPLQKNVQESQKERNLRELEASITKCDEKEDIIIRAIKARYGLAEE